MKRNKLLLGYGMVIASAVIFGCMPLMTGIIRQSGANSITIVLMRNLLPLPVLLLLALAQKKSLRVPVKALPAMACISLLGCCATPALLYTSYTFLTDNDSVATVLHFVYPAMVALGGWIFFRHRLKGGTLLSLVLCLCGIGLFCDPGRPADPTGAALALLSGVTFGAYVLLLSVFPHKQINGFLFSLYVSAISAAVLLLGCALTGQLAFPTDGAGWGMSLFFSMVVNVGAVVLFQNGTFLIGGQRAAILSTMEPMTSILVSALCGATIGLSALAGSGLVVTSAILLAVFDAKE